MKTFSVRLACFMLLSAIFTAVLFSWAPTGQVSAGLEIAVQQQEATGYPELPTLTPSSGPTFTPGGPTSTLPGSVTPGGPTSTLPSSVTPGGPTSTLPGSVTPGGPTTTLPGFVTPTLNPLTPSPIIGRDLFGTEDSEIGNARVTLPPSETPEPSPTLTPAPSATPTPGLLQGFTFNRKLFFGGFIFPLGILLIVWLGYRLFHTGEFSGKKPG